MDNAKKVPGVPWKSQLHSDKAGMGGEGVVFERNKKNLSKGAENT